MKKTQPPKFVPNKQGNARKKEKPRSVRSVLGNDPDRVWYPIDPRFNGYEISDDCYVRSLKLLKKDYGCLIRPRDKTGTKYDMVDRDGERYEFTIDELKLMAQNNPYCVANKTEECISSGRNKSMFRTRAPEKKNLPDKNAIYPVSFTIKPNLPEKKEVICPLYDLNGRRYLGNGYKEEEGSRTNGNY